MRFWVLVFLVVGLVAFTPRAKAQTSLNVLTPSVSGWTGSVPGQNGGYSGGGNGPAYNQTTDTLIFGYATATATQRITAEAFAIQHALDLSNSGIKINGYNYSWYINNSGDQSGTLTGQVNFLRGTSILRTDNYNYNAPTNGFQLYSGTQTFANQESMLAGDSMTLSFTGKDSRFWAGYYGPQVRAPSLTLNYTTDPCLGNPAYSPSCPNYNTVVTSPNLLTGITGPQAYAINQALSNVGAGAMIHGFNYGYDYSVAGRQCSFFDMFGFCLTGYNYSDAGVATVITDSNNATLFSESNVHNGGNNGTSGSYSKQFRFGTSRQITTLGGFAMAPWTSGNASITNMYSNAVYTADPCLDPLSSPSCSGYAAAYFTQQCTANPLYNSACPGYAQAYFTQQCTVNALYDPSCPGYASAYLTYQCSINSLYSTTCVGYQQAYHDQQCSINPLHATTCTGYAVAYKAQQCALDGLYDKTCPNYATAYATKMLLEQQGMASTVATAGTIAQNDAPSTTTASTSVGSDGSVSVDVSKTGDTNVDKAISSPAPTTNSAAAPSAPVQLVAPGPAPAAPAPSAKNESGPTQSARTGDTKPAANPRQELQARRESAAKAQAAEKGKNLANEMGKAADMESQKQIQNLVIEAMGFTPGFDAYSKAVLSDAAGYKPYTVYGGQRVIENRNTSRMFGGTDRLHQEMINQQYK